ncbi:MAG: hypothetical protein M0D57_04555 [Sphingobacteriales bacterium JAD_PAG50586_3]|nr:MAG: hypothetical protein M0D57_04555 [Sphingobacteriales bacterium JAD_PAG50586_3]
MGNKKFASQEDWHRTRRQRGVVSLTDVSTEVFEDNPLSFPVIKNGEINSDIALGQLNREVEETGRIKLPKLDIGITNTFNPNYSGEIL